MNEWELQQLISLYGSELDHWPETGKQALQADPALLQTARLLAAQEAEFERALRSQTFVAHDTGLAQRIIAQVAEPDVVNEVPPSLWQQRFIRPALSVAATLILGVWLGYNLPATEQSSSDENYSDYTALLIIQDDLL